MSSFPLVSIVIPVYNGANYVAEAIESALTQTYSAVEVIVVDDGSNDGGATSQVVRQFEPHVHYIQKSNGGVATALNAGIHAMRGQLFSWLSHDDVYKSDKVARQVEVQRAFGMPCIVLGDFELMDSFGNFTRRISAAGRISLGRPLDAVFQGLINGCTLLIPRELFDPEHMFEPGLPTTQDYHLWYLLARRVPFLPCPHADVRQRVHPLQGSRLNAHLNEASRMFAYLIDSTPLEVMRAYDGSELRFLIRVRNTLVDYAGLLKYLDFRIDELLRHTQNANDLTPEELSEWQRTAHHSSPASTGSKSLRELVSAVVHSVKSNLPGKRTPDALAKMQTPGLPTIFFLTHSLGGGAHRHLAELTRGLHGKANCIVGYGQRDGSIHLSTGSADNPGGVVFQSHQLAQLARILRGAGVTRVDVHHTFGFNPQAERLLDLLEAPFDITMVDYHFIANHPHLCFEDGVFIGDHRLHDPESGMLRPSPLPLFFRADRIIAISRDMAARIQILYPDFSVIPALHWRESSSTRVRHVFPPRLWGPEPLRIVIGGSINLSKGRAVIVDVARLVNRRKLPLRFHVLGQMNLLEEERHECGNVLTVHGPFEETAFSTTLCSIAPHLAWLPAQVPETWSYVLSDFIEATLPVAASGIGAIPERCFGRPATWLLPWEASSASWLDLFLQLHATQLREPPRWMPIDHLPPARKIYFDEYLYPARDCNKAEQSVEYTKDHKIPS